jgi:hypothetical protein
MSIADRFKESVGATVGGVFEGWFRPPVVYVRPRVLGTSEFYGTGTRNDPFITIAAGIRAVRGGGRVRLFGGTYLESVDLTDVSGAAGRPIVVEPYNDEPVIIEWADEEFRGPVPNDAWEPAVEGADDEWVSLRDFPALGTNPDTNRHDRGSFMDFAPISGIPQHVHLVAYDRPEDFREDDNELFPDNVGNEVYVQNEDGTWAANGKRHPFVYLGPGIWFDRHGDRRVHIRLRHTHHGVAGGQEYHGETDPRRLRLAICEHDSHVIRMVDCHNIQFKSVSVRYGGADTIRLRNCSDVLFDHVDVMAGSRAVLMATGEDESNERITFAHCRFDGGLPPWTFRSDRKNAYFFDDGTGGPPYAFDELGYGTNGVLFSGTTQSLATEVHHCEFANAHDVYLFGDSMRFHHNLVDTINDDGLAFINDTKNTQIHENVLTRSHTTLSFDGERIGQVWIYRNLFDTREPTLGNRPPLAAEPRNLSLRTGLFYKDGKTDGPIDFFHNTCLVRTPGMIGVDPTNIMRAAYTLHADHATPAAGHIRRTFNNIFVSANRPPEPKQPLAFLPPLGFGPSDGNCYFRFRDGDDEEDWFWVGAITDDDLAGYAVAHQNEASSTYADPGFLAVNPPHPAPDLTDDLRLHDGGSAVERGVRLEDVALELWDRDQAVTGQHHSPPRPDAGCYARPTIFGITLPLPPRPLEVGVDGRHHYP